MDLVSRLKRDEGFSRFAYKCPGGATTIGYGRNVDKSGGKGISQREAHMLLLFDIQECESDLASIFGALRLKAMGGVRENALINMRFNLGPSGFREFAQMIDAVQHKDWDRAANECLDSRAARMLPRRYGRIAQELRTGVDLDD